VGFVIEKFDFDKGKLDIFGSGGCPEKPVSGRPIVVVDQRERRICLFVGSPISFDTVVGIEFVECRTEGPKANEYPCCIKLTICPIGAPRSVTYVLGVFGHDLKGQARDWVKCVKELCWS